MSPVSILSPLHRQSDLAATKKNRVRRTARGFQHDRTWCSRYSAAHLRHSVRHPTDVCGTGHLPALGFTVDKGERSFFEKQIDPNRLSAGPDQGNAGQGGALWNFDRFKRRGRCQLFAQLIAAAGVVSKTVLGVQERFVHRLAHGHHAIQIRKNDAVGSSLAVDQCGISQAHYSLPCPWDGKGGRLGPPRFFGNRSGHSGGYLPVPWNLNVASFRVAVDIVFVTVPMKFPTVLFETFDDLRRVCFHPFSVAIVSIYILKSGESVNGECANNYSFRPFVCCLIGGDLRGPALSKGGQS